MPVKPDLLEILCCPLTKTALKVVSADTIQKINERISTGQVKYESGAVARDPLQEALITIDEKRIYAVRDNIPVMLVDESISTDQLRNLFQVQG